MRSRLRFIGRASAPWLAAGAAGPRRCHAVRPRSRARRTWRAPSHSTSASRACEGAPHAGEDAIKERHDHSGAPDDVQGGPTSPHPTPRRRLRWIRRAAAPHARLAVLSTIAATEQTYTRPTPPCPGLPRVAQGRRTPQASTRSERRMPTKAPPCPGRAIRFEKNERQRTSNRSRRKRRASRLLRAVVLARVADAISRSRAISLPIQLKVAVWFIYRSIELERARVAQFPPVHAISSVQRSRHEHHPSLENARVPGRRRPAVR